MSSGRRPVGSKLNTIFSSIIIDYLQLMTASVDTRGNREQEVAMILPFSEGDCQGAEHSDYRVVAV